MECRRAARHMQEVIGAAAPDLLGGRLSCGALAESFSGICALTYIVFLRTPMSAVLGAMRQL
ncbi:hypothetical protein CHLRE_06g283826v5 [Chlamydomonas reinhardtii]|uniref:Uncharacterized protein n=1 Tax=Chlamydomonas reinhardtii TaxID=3055 RepID=A0A2K3DPX2_CHLRE|nr:uncharacterized protein CHLRE_06g283826v5 [Chlamydomonas reinhardtii]PNW82557.1 hypothetical protein CHLRE_06g283826v5 [Chlamydomonas reinhardtii]